MLITKKRKLDRILQGLRRDDPEVAHVALFSSTGLLFAHTLASAREAEKLAASAAAFLALARGTQKRLATGAAMKISVACADASLQVLPGASCCLAVLMKPNADEKRFLAYAHAAMREICQILADKGRTR